jgi:UDP-N-acetylglucosamine 1-carboxyvinyltransferase
MDRYLITGRRRLEGSIRASGAKNATLPILTACLLSDAHCNIEEVPKLQDIQVMQGVLESLGCKVNWTANSMQIDCTGVRLAEVPSDMMRRMRASNLVMGPLLGRFGEVKVWSPGGCAIGTRPMDQHIKGLKLMGAEITERHGFIEAKATKLKGVNIHLDMPSVGATENLMMAAVLAEGTTLIRNAAREPEIIDLQNFLNAIGARVRGAGLDVIRIDGVKSLGGATHSVIPDRIEAGTHMVAAAITRGDIEVRNIIPEHVEPVTAKLREAGAAITVGEDWVRVKVSGPLKAVDIRTLPYPGFPTDMQPQIMALLATIEGTSIISESIFENRYQHVNELRRMGANVRVEGRVAVVQGAEYLDGAFVEATDLRAGAALVLAGLAAEEATIVENVEHIDRGYENLEAKYGDLGARITRIASTGGVV